MIGAHLHPSLLIDYFMNIFVGRGFGVAKDSHFLSGSLFPFDEKKEKKQYTETIFLCHTGQIIEIELRARVQLK